MMREILNEYFDKNTLPDFENKDNDPFWDPPQPLQIGVSFLSLKMLSYVFENEAEVKIFSSEGTQAVRGQIKVAYYPCDSNGEGEPDEDLMIDDEQDPSALIGKDLYFRVEIKTAKEIPKELCKETFVTYELKSEPGRQFKTKNFPGMSQTPDYEYKQVHHITPVSEYYLEWFEKDQVSVSDQNILFCFRLRSKSGEIQLLKTLVLTKVPTKVLVAKVKPNSNLLNKLHNKTPKLAQTKSNRLLWLVAAPKKHLLFKETMPITLLLTDLILANKPQRRTIIQLSTTQPRQLKIKLIQMERSMEQQLQLWILKRVLVASFSERSTNKALLNAAISERFKVGF